MKGINLRDWEVRSLLPNKPGLRQLRRVMKPQPHDLPYRRPNGSYGHAHLNADGRMVFGDLPSPHRVGDLVYVREAWRYLAWDRDHAEAVIGYRADGGCSEWTRPETTEWDQHRIWEDAWIRWSSRMVDRYGNRDFYTIEEAEQAIPLTSSQTMPRWASRLTLRITSVRAQRLGDVTVGDLVEEGHNIPEGQVPLVELSLLQKKQWNADNPKHPWHSDLWTWVYGVERVEQSEAMLLESLRASLEQMP